ncbi:MAG: ABC transporter permease, partial [Acidimicrobiales bacterium]
MALLVAVLIEVASFSTSLNSFGRRLAGPTPVRVVGPSSHGGLDPGLLAPIAALSGVRAAIPIVQTVAVIRTADNHQLPIVALGVDCRIQALLGSFGCSPHAVASATNDSLPFVSPTLRRLTTPGERLATDINQLDIAEAPVVAQLDQLNGGRVVLFALPEAQRLFFRVAQFDVIYVQLQPGTRADGVKQQLAAVVGPRNRVLTASDPPPGLTSAASLVTPLLGLIALFAFAIGAMVVFNVVRLSFEERRLDLAVLASMGTTEREITAGALAEAAVLGVIGGLLGCVAGLVVAHPLVAILSHSTEQIGGIRLHVVFGPTALATGTAAGVLCAVAGAIPGARHLRRMNLAAALRDSSEVDLGATRPATRALLAGGSVGGIGLALGGIAGRQGGIHQWQPLVASVGLLMTVVGFTVLFTAVVPVVTARLSRANRANPALLVAFNELEREPRRSRAMALGAGTAVGLGAVLGGFLPGLHHTLSVAQAAEARGTVFVSGLAATNTGHIDSKITPADVARIARRSDVGAV